MYPSPGIQPIARLTRVQRGHESLRLGLVDQPHLDAESLRDAEQIRHLALARLGLGDAQTADVAQPDRLLQLVLQRPDRAERALHDLTLLRRRAELPEQSRRAARRRRTELVALYHQDVALAHLREVIRDAAAEDPAAND